MLRFAAAVIAGIPTAGSAVGADDMPRDLDLTTPDMTQAQLTRTEIEALVAIAGVEPVDLTDMRQGEGYAPSGESNPLPPALSPGGTVLLFEKEEPRSGTKLERNTDKTSPLLTLSSPLQRCSRERESGRRSEPGGQRAA